MRLIDASIEILPNYDPVNMSFFYYIKAAWNSRNICSMFLGQSNDIIARKRTDSREGMTAKRNCAKLRGNAFIVLRKIYTKLGFCFINKVSIGLTSTRKVL